MREKITVKIEGLTKDQQTDLTSGTYYVWYQKKGLAMPGNYSQGMDFDEAMACAMTTLAEPEAQTVTIRKCTQRNI